MYANEQTPLQNLLIVIADCVGRVSNYSSLLWFSDALSKSGHYLGDIPWN
jgi:hypothetical protein